MDPGPVNQLLRCLSDRGPGTGDRGPATTDWKEVVAAAARHRLTPLLFRRLKKRGAQACVPADAWERLRLAYLDSAGRNTRLYRELRTVLGGLRSAGIPVIALKGAYLAEAVYGDVGLRPMSDVDLMVPRAELPRAQAILLDMGGVQEQSEDVELVCRRRQHLLPIVIRNLVVELHWTITFPTGPVRVDAARLWDRARPATIAGVEVQVLSPEDLLLHLCLHTSYCAFLGVGLLPFFDIAATIQHFRNEMDWRQVAERAREWGASRYVGLTFQLVRSMLGTEVPDDVVERLVPGGLDQRILETARECLLAHSGYGRWMPPRPFFSEWRAESFADKVKLPWKRIFLSRDEMAVLYPASRSSRHLYRYYALRLRDVIRIFVSYTLGQSRRMMRSHGRARQVTLIDWLGSAKPR